MDTIHPARFWEKVDARGDCWEWTAFHHDGYGKYALNGRQRMAHRVAYELLVGVIPDGMEIDHLCRNRGCVNPDHMEVVSSRENTLRGFGITGRNARKTHCSKGHEYTPENTQIRTDGNRACRACAREYSLAWYHKNRGKGGPRWSRRK